MPTTIEQRRKSLAHAEAVRMAKFKVRRAVFAGDLELKDALEQSCLARTPILQALKFVKFVGNHKALFILRISKVDPRRQVGALTVRERAAILSNFEIHGPPSLK